jgi:hypothetical protein
MNFLVFLMSVNSSPGGVNLMPDRNGIRHGLIHFRSIKIVDSGIVSTKPIIYAGDEVNFSPIG